MTAVNALFRQNKHHLLAFLHHLSLKTNNAATIIKLFTDDYAAKCLPFTWMKTINDSLRVYAACTMPNVSFSM